MMAIAAIVLHSLGNLPELQKTLGGMPWVVDKQHVPPNKLAVTVESPSDKLLSNLKEIKNLPDVLDLELIYVNYEDDLDAGGNMACPPFSEICDKLRR